MFIKKTEYDNMRERLVNLEIKNKALIEKNGELCGGADKKRFRVFLDGKDDVVVVATDIERCTYGGVILRDNGKDVALFEDSAVVGYSVEKIKESE